MGIEPNSNRTNRTRTHILGRTEPS